MEEKKVNGGACPHGELLDEPGLEIKRSRAIASSARARSVIVDRMAVCAPVDPRRSGRVEVVGLCAA